MGSKTTRRYCVNVSTVWLKTTDERLLIVWHTHMHLTPYESCSKCTKPSMAEPTCKGEQDVKSKLHNNYVWGNEWMMRRLNCMVLAILRPPTPCQRMWADSVKWNVKSNCSESLSIKSCKRRINEWPRIKPWGVPMLDYPSEAPQLSTKGIKVNEL